MIKKDVIANGAALYDESALPLNAGPIQRAETKVAFYAGAYWAMVAVMNFSNELDEDHASEQLTAMLDECKNFGDNALGTKI